MPGSLTSHAFHVLGLFASTTLFLCLQYLPMQEYGSTKAIGGGRRRMRDPHM
ncbi:hypothetical protein M440DRAFT_1396053, partial [Trichoderma longibrachiatum ATCC 18648]